MKKIFKIEGMHCTSCSILIEGELEDIGVDAKVSYAKGLLQVQYDENKISETDIRKAVRRAGYTLGKQ